MSRGERVGQCVGPDLADHSPRGGAFAEESAAVATNVVADVVRPARGEPGEPVVDLADQPADRLVARYPKARHLTDTVPIFMRVVKAA